MTQMQKDLKNYTYPELAQLITELGEKKYLAKYIFSFIHAKDAVDINDITPLAKPFRQKLTEAGYYISRLNIVEKFIDPDGTIKYLFELPDGLRIESVLLTDDGPKKRRTICLSCQVGCRMKCKFCATGYLKFERNLTAAEIAEQFNLAAKDTGTINNIVYMGMGEPLDNYENVIRSAAILNHHAGKNIGQRHITISTCGLPMEIQRLADEQLQPRLAVSLHAPTDELRAEIMSVARSYPIKELIDSTKAYQKKINRRITFEYCMIKGLNDSLQHAEKLAKLLKDVNASINLIEYNPHPGCDFKPTHKERIKIFADFLHKAGFETIIRYKRGQKIKAACGQLGAAYLKK